MMWAVQDSPGWFIAEDKLRRRDGVVISLSPELSDGPEVYGLAWLVQMPTACAGSWKTVRLPGSMTPLQAMQEVDDRYEMPTWREDE